MPCPPAKVLFLATDLSTGGGVNKVIRDLAVLFRRKLGAEVTVVNARSDRASTYPFPADVRVERHRRQSLAGYFLLLLRLRRARPDFVVSSWTQDNILVTLAFLFSGSKAVVAEHASRNHHKGHVQLLRRLIYPLAWRVIVLNPHDLAYHSRHLGNVRLIPNPVEPPRLIKGEREKLVLAVGHLEPIKNVADAIRAMAASGLEQQGWSLVIVGSGSCKPALQTLISELELKRTRIVEPTNDLASWYARASVLLVTSRLESFSLVLAEAMLAGVIPVAYASDGPSYILEDFPEHLVAIGDVEALRTKLMRFATTLDVSLRERLSHSVATRFSPDAVAERWKQLLSGD
jgi:glycosyltransferase involved in cell wall biosynthesis